MIKSTEIYLAATWKMSWSGQAWMQGVETLLLRRGSRPKLQGRMDGSWGGRIDRQNLYLAELGGGAGTQSGKVFTTVSIDLA